MGSALSSGAFKAIIEFIKLIQGKILCYVASFDINTEGVHLYSDSSGFNNL